MLPPLPWRFRRWDRIVWASLASTIAVAVTYAFASLIAAAVAAVIGIALIAAAYRLRLSIGARGIDHVDYFDESFALRWDDVTGVEVDSVRFGAPGSTGGSRVRIRFLRRGGAPVQCTGYDGHAEQIIALFASRGLATHDRRSPTTPHQA